MSDIGRKNTPENIIPFVLLLAIMLVVIWVRNVSPAVLMRYQLDKVAHFSVSFLLAMLCYSVFVQYQWGTFWTTALASAWTLVLGWMREAAEYLDFVANAEKFAPHYGVEITHDLLANFCGVFAFLLALWVWRRYCAPLFVRN
ncbi:MAG: hypothetical protein Q7R73_04830 [bacterium]|nr:hypothetical protein [bacterium]